MTDHQGWLTPAVCVLLARQLHNVRDRAALRQTCRVCARSVVLISADAYPIFGWASTNSHIGGSLIWYGRYTDGNTVEHQDGKTDSLVSIHCSVWAIEMAGERGFGRAIQRVIRESTHHSRLRDSYQFVAAFSPVSNVTVLYVYDVIRLGTKTLHRYNSVFVMEADRASWEEELAKFPTIFASVKDYLVLYLYTTDNDGHYVIIHKQDYAALMEELAELSAMLEHESRARMRAYVSKVRQGL